MIGFEKKIVRAKEVRRRKRFSGFAIDKRAFPSDAFGDKALVGWKSKNCRIVDGVLTTGQFLTPFRLEGVQMVIPATMTTTDQFFYLINKHDGIYEKTLGIISEEGMSYWYCSPINTWVVYNNFKTPMKVIPYFGEDGTSYAILVGKAGVYASTTHSTKKSETIKSALTVACAFKDRVFCAPNERSIAYSTALAPSDFVPSIDDGGTLHLTSEKGNIVALLEFCDGVYVFYEYGIARIDVAGKARDMKVTPLDLQCSRIFGDSVAVCSGRADRAFMLTEDGLFLFDGKHIQPVCQSLQIKPMRSNQKCRSAANGTVYTVQFLDETGDTRRIVVDADSLLGYDSFAVEGLSAAAGQLLCRYNGEPHSLLVEGTQTCLLPDGEEYEFAAYNVDFGNANDKRLVELEFFGDGDVTVAVSSERRTKTRALNFIGGRARVRLWLRGKRFSFVFTLAQGSCVRSMTADVIYD